MSRIRIVLALAAVGTVGWSMIHSARMRPMERPAPEALSEDAPRWRGRFPNVPLLTHDGRTVRFYDDLVRGKIVTINFMYVECEGTCPGTTSTLVEVRKELGDRVGRDILMLSITLQPEADTPDRLRDYARRYGAGRGMVFLTGTPADIDVLRHALGFSDERNPQQDADRSKHLGVLRIGNEPRDWWTACPSLSGAAQIVTLLRSVDAAGSPAKPPLENPEGPPSSTSLGLQDLREFDVLRSNLEWLHMTRSTMEFDAYIEQVLAKMAQYLKLRGEREAAWRAAMKAALAESLKARRRMEAVRVQKGNLREAWGRYLEDQSRAMEGVGILLDDSPRHQAFRDHGSRWLFTLEGHPDHADKPR